MKKIEFKRITFSSKKPKANLTNYFKELSEILEELDLDAKFYWKKEFYYPKENGRFVKKIHHHWFVEINNETFSPTVGENVSVIWGVFGRYAANQRIKSTLTELQLAKLEVLELREKLLSKSKYIRNLENSVVTVFGEDIKGILNETKISNLLKKSDKILLSNETKKAKEKLVALQKSKAQKEIDKKNLIKKAMKERTPAQVALNVQPLKYEGRVVFSGSGNPVLDDRWIYVNVRNYGLMAINVHRANYCDKFKLKFNKK
jgi:hypothetical protein